MNEKIINTKKGQVTLTQNGIKIDDDATFNRNLIIISSIVWCFYGGLNIFRYAGSQNYFYFYFGVFILALWIVVMAFVVFRVSFAKNYSLSDLKEVKFRKDKEGIYHARLITQKGRIRTLTLNNKKETVNRLIRQMKKQKVKVEQAF